VLLSSPDSAAVQTYRRYQAALQEVFAPGRIGAASAVDLPDIFVRTGLVGVDVAVHGRSWAGGTPGTTLHAVLAVALHDRLVAAGMGADELSRLRHFLADPQVLVLSRPVLSIIGRRRRSPVI
jgi:hypothetical protein